MLKSDRNWGEWKYIFPNKLKLKPLDFSDSIVNDYINQTKENQRLLRIQKNKPFINHTITI